jgi:hypothetical protein
MDASNSRQVEVSHGRISFFGEEYITSFNSTSRFTCQIIIATISYPGLVIIMITQWRGGRFGSGFSGAQHILLFPA